MGTNFYAKDTCEHCGRGGEKHIGKSSAGWCFSLRIYPEEGLNTLEDWKKFLVGKRIFDEYGDELDLPKMLEWITERRNPHVDYDNPPHGYASWAAFHAANSSEPGPHGLLRHKGCAGYGEGTWDYIEGEFS